MHIVYLHQYFVTPSMTGGTRSYEMGRRLAEYGHEVTVVTSWREGGRGGDWFETQEAGMRVLWLPVEYSNRMSNAERMRAFARFALGSARRARELKGDVVLASSTPLTIAIPGVAAAKALQVPLVFEVRDLWPALPIAVGALKNPFARFAARQLELFAYRNAARIIALSPGMMDGIVKTGYPADRVVVIPNGADLDLFGRPQQGGVPSFLVEAGLAGSRLVVYAGTFGRINGVDYLARVAARSDELGFDTQFVVIGKGGEEDRVRGEAVRLGVLGRNFHMFPPIAKQVVPEVLAAADLVLSLFVDLPEMWANSANKFFDGLASGTAVGINYGGWQAELLRESGAGIVFPPADETAAATEIHRFVSSREDVLKAGRAARELAERRFARDLLAGQLNDVLLGVQAK
jgi:glycosyltransferase involved in cell wall biosynthesis